MKRTNRLSKAGQFFAVLLVIVALAACSQVGESPAPETSQTASGEAVNASLGTMAKLFAKAVTNESVRTQLHALAGERFDGDTNVLYSTLVAQADLTTQSGKQSADVRQELAKAYAQSGVAGQSLTSQSEALASVDVLADTIPRFQVAVPAKFDAWNPKVHTPLVGYVPVGVEDTTLETITAFDAEGNVHTLDAQTAPEQPVVILSTNERTDEAGNVLPGYASNAAQGASDTSGLAPQSDRANAYMNKVYLRDDNEPWIKGDPEIKLIAASKNDDLGYHGSFPGVNDERKWYTRNRWLGSTHSDVIYYWYEDDGGSLDLTVSYKGFSLGIKIDDDDDFMGAVQVPHGYLNSYPTRWDLGDLIFYSN